MPMYLFKNIKCRQCCEIEIGIAGKHPEVKTLDIKADDKIQLF